MTKLERRRARALSYSTYLGGSRRRRRPRGSPSTGRGNAYVTGYTEATNFPTAHATDFDTYNGGDSTPSSRSCTWPARALDCSTRPTSAGSIDDHGTAIAVDAATEQRLRHRTDQLDSDFPTTPARFDTSYNGDGDAFVTKLDTGTCVSDAQCSDLNACNGVETCSAGTCQPGTAPDCTDSNACTDDSCNPAVGCVNAPDNTNTCSDGNACTQADACVAGQCLGANPVLCNDSNACTDDACNPASGQCVFTNDNSNACTDGDACSQTDSCQAGQCVGSNPVLCEDSNACTDDACNPATRPVPLHP